MTALFFLHGGKDALERTGWPGVIAGIAIVAILIFWPRYMGR